MGCVGGHGGDGGDEKEDGEKIQAKTDEFLAIKWTHGSLRD